MGVGNPRDFSFIYYRRAFKAWFQSWFLDFYTHSCMSGSWPDLLGGELSEGQKMCLIDTWDLRHSDPELRLQAVRTGGGGHSSINVMEGAAEKVFQPPDSSVWTLTSTTFLPWKRNACLYFKILEFDSTSIQQMLIEHPSLFCATHWAKSYKDENYSSWERRSRIPGPRPPGFKSQLHHSLDVRCSSSLFICLSLNFFTCKAGW